MNRRRIVVVGSSLVLGLPGCLDRSADPGTTATKAIRKETATRTPESTAQPGTTLDDSPETTTPETTTSQPVTTPDLNRTSYPVTRESNLRRPVLGETLAPRLTLLTTADWRARVNESVLSAERRSFLSETDFDSETVVAFQTQLSDGLNRLILHTVEGVGTDTITLVVEQWEASGGQNVILDLLLLVRVPNRGAEPVQAEVTWTGTSDEG